MAVTIRDIANHANVSITTVSRVLNKKPDVKEETRDRVNRTIRELGYTPNIVARGLVLKRSNVIGFIVPDITNPNLPELARGIVNKARSYGYNVMIFDTNHDKRVEKEAIRVLQSKQVAGIILSFNEANKEELEKLKVERFPIVQIYRKSSQSVVSTIALDNVHSGYTATNHLIELGHRRIAHISVGVGVQSGTERLEGYRKALSDAGIDVDKDLVQFGSNNAESGYKCMIRLLELPPGRLPTSVFVCHDSMAAGVYDAVFDKGLSIPEDISIIGHDNNLISTLIRPKLTTVDTFKFQLGEAGVELLMEEIGNDKPLNKEIIVKPELFLRDSTRRI